MVDYLSGSLDGDSSDAALAVVDAYHSSGHAFKDFLRQLPHSDRQYLDCRPGLTVTNVSRPIGLCLLPSGNVVVASSAEDAVRGYSPQGDQVFSAQAEFCRPSDVCALPDGRFAVRDDRSGIQARKSFNLP